MWVELSELCHTIRHLHFVIAYVTRAGPTLIFVSCFLDIGGRSESEDVFFLVTRVHHKQPDRKNKLGLLDL